MTQYYNSTEIYNFYELPEADQTKILEETTPEEAEEQKFVLIKHPKHGPEFLPLNMFLKVSRENNFTHAIYGLSYFSAYFLTHSRSADCGIISYKTF